MNQNFIIERNYLKAGKSSQMLARDKNAPDLVFNSINAKINGRFKLYEMDSRAANKLEYDLEKRSAVLCTESQAGFLQEFLKQQEIAEIATIQNVCLQKGVGIYEDAGPSSVSRIVAGTFFSPSPSTFNTQQSLQQPLPQLTFPRMGSWEKSNIANGYRWTFAFRRPAISCGGIEITEMGVQVAEGNNLALLNRVWAPNAGLPHILSTSQDTVCIVEIDKVYL